MYKHILVPLDGSHRAELALPVAARIARFSGGSVTLLGVVTPLIEMDIHSMELAGEPALEMEEEMKEAAAYLARQAASPDLAGVAVRAEVLSGPAAKTILLYEQMQRVDLIVMCSHGATGIKRWTLGSVSQKVARHSTVPVLVLREDGLIPLVKPREEAIPFHVLVALDGSEPSEATLVPAANLCAALAAPDKGTLHLVQVLRLLEGENGENGETVARINREAVAATRDYLARTARRLRDHEAAQLHLGVTSSVITHYDAADAIIKAAEHGEFLKDTAACDGCGIIAMATHGRSGLDYWIMGSVTGRVLNATMLPLLVVRATPTQPQTGKVASAAATA